MLVIGLTGGVASGKSLAGRYFEALGIAVIDADALAREVVVPGSEGLAAVTEALGEGVLAADGTLDRSALRRRIFEDDEARERLEGILHPRIRALMDARVEARRSAGDPYCVTVVPLLVEKGQEARCDRVLVVDAPEPVQIARLQARDGTDTNAARAMLAHQCPRARRLARADDVIANGDAVPPDIGVRCQVAALDRKYRALAAAPGTGTA